MEKGEEAEKVDQFKSGELKSPVIIRRGLAHKNLSSDKTKSWYSLLLLGGT